MVKLSTQGRMIERAQKAVEVFDECTEFKMELGHFTNQKEGGPIHSSDPLKEIKNFAADS